MVQVKADRYGEKISTLQILLQQQDGGAWVPLMVVIVTAGVPGRVTGYRGADFNVYRGVKVDTSAKTCLLKGSGTSWEGKWGKEHRSFFDSKQQSCRMNIRVPFYGHDEMPEAG